MKSEKRQESNPFQITPLRIFLKEGPQTPQRISPVIRVVYQVRSTHRANRARGSLVGRSTTLGRAVTGDTCGDWLARSFRFFVSRV